MRVSKKRRQALEKRIAGLEGQVQNQRNMILAIQQAVNSGRKINIMNRQGIGESFRQLFEERYKNMGGITEEGQKRMETEIRIAAALKEHDEPLHISSIQKLLKDTANDLEHILTRDINL